MFTFVTGVVVGGVVAGGVAAALLRSGGAAEPGPDRQPTRSLPPDAEAWPQGMLDEQSSWPDALPVAACEIDGAGIVVHATATARTLFGDDLVGRPFESVLPDFEALDEHRSEVWKGPGGVDLGRVWHLDARLPDDSPLPVRVQKAAAGEHQLVCLRDMRSVRARVERLTRANAKLEERIAEEEQLSRAKSTYLAGVAQVLRTPLTAILGYGELVREELEDRELEELYGDVDRITAAAGALQTILETVLDWTEIQAGRMSVQAAVFDAGDAIAEVVDELRAEVERGGNELVVQLPERMLVLADVHRTAQIVRTLLRNAATHTSSGQVLVALRRDGDRILVRVGDTGSGMAPGELEELFVSFEQRAMRKDAGRPELSLLLAHTFATMMGGTLAVESAPGEGTELTLALPAHDDTEFTPPMLLDD